MRPKRKGPSMSPAPCISPATERVCVRSADLRSLTDGYGVFTTGSDGKCTPSSRPFRKIPNPTRSETCAGAASRPDNDRACASKLVGGIGAETTRVPVVTRRGRTEQGDGRQLAPYGITAENFSDMRWDALGCLTTGISIIKGL